MLRRSKNSPKNTRAYTDLAIWVSYNYASDVGASKLLQAMHLEYDVIVSGDDLTKYNCIVLPDRVNLSEDDKLALKVFAENGGSIVASYESVFDELGIKKLEPSSCDADFIKCDIDEVTTPFLSYSSAYKVESNGEVLADCYEPYFNRTLRHFCGHKNTPYKNEKADYPALVECGNVIYFAHPVFKAYNDSGSYVLERYIMKAIDRVYERGIVTHELPSAARIRLREGEGFLALHVLYSPPINRGNVCLLSDFPKLHDVVIDIKTEKKITQATYEPTGELTPFTQNGDTVTLNMPPFSLHQLVILK